MKKPLLGQMRNNLTFQRAIQLAPDENYNKTTRWVKVFTTMGKVEALNPNVFSYGDNLEPTATHKMVIRYHELFDTSQRVLFDSRYFKIISADPYEEGKKAFLVLIVEQVDTDL